MKKISELEKLRKQYKPKLPPSMRNGILNVEIKKGEPTESMGDQELIKKAFPNTYGLPILKFKSGKASRESKPLNVGVVLSGGQAPGGHNAIAGIYDAIVEIHPSSKLFGFLGGPSGLEEGPQGQLDRLRRGAREPRKPRPPLRQRALRLGLRPTPPAPDATADPPRRRLPQRRALARRARRGRWAPQARGNRRLRRGVAGVSRSELG